MRKLIFLIVALLIACGPSEIKMYNMTSRDRWTVATIETHWINKSNIDSTCKKLGTNDEGATQYKGCARSKPGDMSICEIYTVRPEDFDDTDKLQSLGHELWHCLGATHK
jgi:hypothetical protein